MIAALDQNFFRVRFDRLTPSERTYLRAMADLGDGPARRADVAKSLDRTTDAAGPVRDSLIRKGMLYSPELGVLDFTVPLFGDFMRGGHPVAGDSIHGSSPAYRSRRKPIASRRVRRVYGRPPPESLR
ncbi:MAG: hypothetical protein ACR2FH_06640 [Caulobacteraceae bacterium]